jgi:hypothetical protein
MATFPSISSSRRNSPDDNQRTHTILWCVSCSGWALFFEQQIQVSGEKVHPHSRPWDQVTSQPWAHTSLCFSLILGLISSDFTETSSIPANWFLFNFLPTSSFFFLYTNSDTPSCLLYHSVSPNNWGYYPQVWTSYYCFDMKCPLGFRGSRPGCQLVSFGKTAGPWEFWRSWSINVYQWIHNWMASVGHCVSLMPSERCIFCLTLPWSQLHGCHG